ncbi:MAG: RnfABCDGE type electron transport complex subunit D [Planctomycetota bacterium]
MTTASPSFELPEPPAAAVSNRDAAATPVQRYWRAQCMALALPMLSGFVLFGWRGTLTLLLVLAGSAAGYVLWRQTGRRGPQLAVWQTAWLGLVIAVLLPADFAATGGATGWLILLAAGFATTLVGYLAGGSAAGTKTLRVQPSVIVYLLLTFLLGGAMVPNLALLRDHALTGDLASVVEDRPTGPNARAWIRDGGDRLSEEGTSVFRVPASLVLREFTAREAPRGDQPAALTGRIVSMASVLRDRMPPLEDLIILGHPTPLGLASTIALVAGGMFLLYRGLTDVRVVVLTLLSAYVALALLPVPAVVSTEDGGAIWTWAIGLGGLGSGQVGWDIGLTFVHYELLAGPIVFIALYLAPVPSVRPLVGRWRVAWALLLGPALVVGQRYFGAAVGPFVALAAMTLLSPLTDRLVTARPINV